MLAAGESGFELDTSLVKIGDGVTPWNGLVYQMVTTKDQIGLGTGSAVQHGSLGLGIAPYSNAGLSVKKTTGPCLILQSGDTNEGNATSPFVVRRGLDGVVTTFIDSFGAINTVAAIRCLGNLTNCGTVAADGTFTSGSTTGTGISTMIDVYSDTAVGVVIRPQVSGYTLQTLDGSGNFVFSIERNGDLQWGGGASHALQDVVLTRIAPDTLALQRGTNVQSFRVYGTTTGPKYLQIQHDGTSGVISANSGHINIASWIARNDGHFTPNTNNTLDLGTVSAMPRTVYAGTSVIAPTFQTSTALVATGGGSGTPVLVASSTGGAGQPTTANQNGWLKATDSTGATVWIPVWK